MNKLTLTLPWPPSVNHYKKVGRIVQTKTGKLYQQRVNNNETKQFYFDVWALVKQSFGRNSDFWSLDEAIELEVRVSLHPPTNRPYDLDNRLKVLFDSLTRAKVIKDDSQISRLYAEKGAMIEHGQTIVEILEITK